MTITRTVNRALFIVVVLEGDNGPILIPPAPDGTCDMSDRRKRPILLGPLCRQNSKLS